MVDDDKNTRLLYKALLSCEGSNTLMAENGAEALPLMDREHIDLVILDIMITV